MGLIFAEFVTSLKSPKIDTAKNKPYYTSSLIVIEIAKIGLGENLTHLPSIIFAQKISRREKFRIYGTSLIYVMLVTLSNTRFSLFARYFIYQYWYLATLQSTSLRLTD